MTGDTSTASLTSSILGRLDKFEASRKRLLDGLDTLQRLHEGLKKERDDLSDLLATSEGTRIGLELTVEQLREQLAEARGTGGG